MFVSTLKFIVLICQSFVFIRQVADLAYCYAEDGEANQTKNPTNNANPIQAPIAV